MIWVCALKFQPLTDSILSCSGLSKDSIMAKPSDPKTVATLKHDDAKRRNIPTAEYQSMLENEQQRPKEVRYPRNTDLDPQLVWRGKDEQDWSDLVVHAPPLYIQEQVHPKALIDDLMRSSLPSPAGGRGVGGEGNLRIILPWRRAFPRPRHARPP